MRQERTVQATIFQNCAFEIGEPAISQWLDGQRALMGLVTGDLRRHGLRKSDGTVAGKGGAALCTAQATAAVGLRRAGRTGIRLVPSLCHWPGRQKSVHQTISAIALNLGGGQSGAVS